MLQVVECNVDYIGDGVLYGVRGAELKFEGA